MATFGDVLRVAIERGEIRIQQVCGRVMEVSRANKRRPAFIKIATTEETVSNYFSKPKEAGFLIHIDGDLLNSIAKEIDDKAREGGEPSP
ncbi:hypothetical protein PV433_26045 [Paenibacillus sp. GYB004]|uniref:hypothetical protein n=1 Tax=Paenibacillus sp. GYB004 TaxID=2994393 RepID=UPI002F96A96B